MNDQNRLGPALLESMWRHRFVVVVSTILLGGLGYVYALQEPPTYEASAELFLSDPTTTPGIDTGRYVDPDQFVPQQSARAQSRTVFEAAAANLGTSAGDLADVVTIESDAQDLSLTVTATAGSGQAAADRANAVATAFMAVNEQSEEDKASAAVEQLEQQIIEREQQLQELETRLDADPQNLALQSQIQNLSDRIIELETTVSGVRVTARLRGTGVSLFESAEAPSDPARPKPRITAVSFAFLGAVLSSMWAYWYAGKSQRVLLRGDPEAVLGVPLLGEIPLYRIAANDPLSGLLRVDPAAAEAYEFVLSSIEFALGEMGGRSLLVTSTLPGDGKTTTTLQLAIAASRDRRRVVLVDADIRARGLTNVLGAEERVGLSDLAALDLQTVDVMRRYRFSEQSQIPVVTAGARRGDPAALLRTHAFRRAMQGISDYAELLIVDSSPLLAVADATIVAGAVDGMVIVVSHGTPFSELVKVRERLKFVSTPLLGYIFNRSDAATAAAYGYGYGMTEDVDGERRLLPSRPKREGRWFGRPGAQSTADSADGADRERDHVA